MTSILIDDDKLIQLSWKLSATRAGVELFCFSSCEEFEKHITRFDQNVNIFIDSDLGNKVRGELISKNYFELGFKNIFLTTGFIDLENEHFPWIKKITGKKPPF